MLWSTTAFQDQVNFLYYRSAGASVRIVIRVHCHTSQALRKIESTYTFWADDSSKEFLPTDAHRKEVFGKEPLNG